MAAQHARAAALIAAVARSLAKRKQGQGKDDNKGEDPPRPRRVPLTIDGEVPLDAAASGRTPQPGPPRPDGSYTPHGLRDGYAHSQPVDIALWKQADYGQMGHAREVTEQWQRAKEASEVFGAETNIRVAPRKALKQFIKRESAHNSRALYMEAFSPKISHCPLDVQE